MKDYKIHELCEAVPPASDDDYKQLKSSIDRNGYDTRMPIYLTIDNKIIDGRTRYQICQKLKIEPVFEIVHRWDIFQVLSNNDVGNRCTDGQLACIVNDLKDMRAIS